MDFKSFKKITRRRVNVIKKPIVDYFKNKDVKNRALYSTFYNKLSVKENYVLYESRDGKSMTDNPYAIFQYLLNDKKRQNLFHIWSISDMDYLNSLKLKYRSYSNVKFVLRNSKDYFRYLATSKYLLNNSTFNNIFTIKDEQVYINTWHGTPLKYMGNDIKGQPMGPANIIRNFLSADYIISPNQFTTRIFNESFKLKGLFNGEMIEEGYPRIDLTINTDIKEVERLLLEEGILVGDKKVILYAPTWKGAKVSEPRNDVDKIYKDMSMLIEEFGDEYKVLVKVHPFLYQHAKSNHLLKDILVPDTFETNKLLSITDILITDYSSIFFDYLITKKPILFYMWDYDDYKTNRGMYFDVQELPGPISINLDSLIKDIKNIESIKENYRERYDSFLNEFCNHDYGNVTKKIVEIIFDSKRSADQNNGTTNNVHSAKSSSSRQRKEKILIYPGGLKNNGITGALLNLLENIDYEKYDVSLLVNFTSDQEAISNMLKVDDSVRLIFKIGRINQTISEYYRNYIIRNRGINSKNLESIFPSAMYKREFKRIFGKSKFDYIIDYSGYSMFWPNILLAGEAKKKMIFMHSDMYSDMNRKIGRRRPHYINLRGVFSLYKYFDEIVSVSEATMNLNKENLANYIGDTKISYMINSINPKKIKRLATDDSEIYYKKNKPVTISIKCKKNAVAEINDIPIPIKDENMINFVNMGRLSPEKGQDQLIRAFDLIHKEYKNTRLYIIGEGPSRQKLEQLIHALDLEKAVFLTGHRPNPFYLLNLCDAFVLSSHYEGQPLVLLEALTLGLPTIATDIVANRYVLENGKYGNLVENSIHGLYEGMASVIEGSFSQTYFDADRYNVEAMSSFYEKLDN